MPGLGDKWGLLCVSLWGSSVEELASNYPDANPEHLNRIGDRLREIAAVKDARRSLLPPPASAERW